MSYMKIGSPSRVTARWYPGMIDGQTGLWANRETVDPQDAEIGKPIEEITVEPVPFEQPEPIEVPEEKPTPEKTPELVPA